jgi:hypothetical protein
MTDTSPDISEMMRVRLMARSSSDRFVMGARMFEAARTMILASFPPGLPPAEAKRRLYARLYGVPPPF